MAAPSLTKPGTTYWRSPGIRAISAAWATFLTLQTSGCRVVSVPVRTILDLSTVTTRSWASPLPKSTFSKPWCIVVRTRFLNLASSCHDADSRRREVRSPPTPQLANKVRILRGAFLVFKISSSRDEVERPVLFVLAWLHLLSPQSHGPLSALVNRWLMRCFLATGNFIAHRAIRATRSSCNVD